MIYPLAYLAVMAVAARWLAPHVLDLMDDDPDTFVIVMSRALSLIIASFWPLVLIGAVLMWRTPESRGQLKQKLAARDARITELEHELGTGQK